MAALDLSLALIIRYALACLLVSAAAHKLWGFSSFRTTLQDYQLIPAALASSVAVALIGAELAIALGFLFEGWVAIAAGFGAGLFTIYAAAMGINLLRGRTHIDCGCFGPGNKGEPISLALVLRNLGLAMVSAICILPVAHRQLVWLDAFTVVGGLLFLAAIYAATNRLISPVHIRTTSSATGE